MCGTSVYNTDDIAPPMTEMNNNIFRQSSDNRQASSSDDKHWAIRPMSPFEYAQMFYLNDKLSLKLAESKFFHLLEAGIPGRTSYTLITCVYERLLTLRRDSIDFFGAEGSPDSVSPISTFSSAIGARLPDYIVWKSSFSADKEFQLMMDLIANPSLVKKINLEKLHHVYQAPMRRGLITMEK